MGTSLPGHRQGLDYLDVEKFIAAKIAEGLSPKKVRDAVSVTSFSRAGASGSPRLCYLSIATPSCLIHSWGAPEDRRWRPRHPHPAMALRRPGRHARRTRGWSAQRHGARRFLVCPADRAAAQPGQVPPGHRPPALRAAGLPEALRTYDIRHSHASLLIEQGANLLAIAQRMGHTDPAVTLRVYGHLFAGVQEDLTRRLEDLRHVGPAPAGGDVVQISQVRRSGPAHH